MAVGKATMPRVRRWVATTGLVSIVSIVSISAAAMGQKPAPPSSPTQSAQKPGPSATTTPGITPPPDYVIGPEDILSIIVWREKDLTVDVPVRPDGKITLPLVNDVQAAGLTPEQLRQQLTEATSKLIAEPNVTVMVKAINSRKVFLMGQVSKPGTYPLLGPTTVMQLIATASGLLEYADEKNILVIRNEGGRQTSIKFNYKEVSEGKKLEQNILLKPGDTVVVP